jgi:hydrogenase nickel incorporation protein HypA/HybF
VHEGPVTESILKIVLDYAEEKKAERVTKVHVTIGEMTGYVEDSIRFYWDSLTVGTKAEGAELEISYVPIRIKCGSCGNEYIAPDQFSLFCPSCGFFGGTTVTGKELTVDSIEIERVSEGV